MKLARFACSVALLLGLSAVLGAAPSGSLPPNKTYAIVGDVYAGANPNAATLDAVAREIDAAMQAHGFKFTRTPGTAGTVITVRFTRTGYEIDYHEFIPHSRYALDGLRAAAAQAVPSTVNVFYNGDPMERGEQARRDSPATSPVQR